MWCLLLSLSSIASAEPAAEPTLEELERGRVLYENGETLYAEGRYDDAIVAWREGYELTELPGFLYNIANAQERLGDISGALDTLSRYRAFAPAEEREVLDRRMRSLEARLPATPVPVPAPVPAPAPEPTPAPQPVARGSSPVRPIVGGSLLGLGVAGVATGAVFGLQSTAAGKDAGAFCTEAGLCASGAADPLQKEKTSALVADVSFATGLVLAAGGTVVFLTGGGGEDGVALGLSPTGVSIALRR